MASRPPPPALRRLVFGFLFVLALLIPLVLWILVGTGYLTDPAGVLTLVRWWSAVTMLLLIWSAIHIKEEPGMGRVALYLGAALFALFTLFGGSNTNLGTTNSGGEPAKSQQVQKAGKLQEAIVGKWQGVGHPETDEYLKDGTLVIKADDGKTIVAKYFFLGPNRMQIFPVSATLAKSFIYTDLVIKGETLTMTTDTGSTSYRRVKSKADTAGIAGSWKTEAGSLFVFVPDGTFILGVDEGPWELNGKQFVAKSNHANGSTWKFTLSSDGRTLSGTWSDPAGHSGSSTITRRPASQKLENAIVGRWQLAGHTETQEYSKDGVLVMIPDKRDETVTLNYSVSDSSHIQLSAPGNASSKSGVFTIGSMKDDAMSLSIPDGSPMTYVRVK